MPIASLKQTLLNQVEALEKKDMSAVEGRFNDSRHRTLPEAIAKFEQVMRSLRSIVDLEEDEFKELPINVISNLTTIATNLNTHWENLKRTKQQQQFDQFVGQVEGARTNLLQWDLLESLPFLSQLENSRAILADTSQELRESLRRTEQLETQLDALISPAVSNSLAKAFGDRATQLRTNGYLWLVLSLVAFGIAVFATWSLASSVIDALAATSGDDGGQLSTDSAWLVFFLRSLVLVPVYFGMVYSFRRLGREREFEEEYEHKKSVATALPNYADLATDPAVKDSILSSAADVIFRLPGKTKITEKEVPDIATGVELVKQLNETVENANILK